MVPKPDEQIGGEANQFPTNKQQQQAVGNDDSKHRRGKEGQETEEAREVFVVRHVAIAVNENEQANERDHREHGRGERIEHPTKLHPRVAKLKPIEIVKTRGCAVMGRVLNRIA